MASGRTHRRVGAVVGGGYAAYRAREQEPWQLITETLGGIGGGVVGGNLPDSFEPALGWNHRRAAHSVAAGLGLAIAAQQVESWAAQLRKLAVGHLLVAGSTLADEQDRRRAWVLAILCLLLAGFLNGLLSGYLSHLVLDGFTPAGLPIV